MINPNLNPYQPREAIIVERIQEAPDLFTLRLEFTDPQIQAACKFEPGQFNMLYLYGVGEIAISIVSDPQDCQIIDHTIRVVGRVTRGLVNLKAGDRIGVRGPYGRGWPMLESKDKDIVVVTGGLGCAPVVSVINYIEQRREEFGRLNIVQGVKHSADLIWKERYEQWRKLADTKVLLAADVGEALWPWHVGPVTSLFDQLEFDPDNVSVMMCGPEGMMRVVCDHMLDYRVPESQLFLSMERNMQCAIGHCGHCQYGSKFICKDGPVFSYDKIRHLFETKGF
ncbi:MAG: Ni/Fe hydrogenase subunit gamma [Thiotrichaceae bacterium]|nr:MAG: Ni/Fe hydrogenase subunit gamma [Thiotrichaceae bacterium]